MTSKQNNTIQKAINDFISFISQFIVPKGQEYNYTRIGKYPNSGSYFIPDGINNAQFINKYSELYELLSRDGKLSEYVFNFSAKPKDIGPLMTDYDFEFAPGTINFNLDHINDHLKHKYTEEDIKDVISFMNSLIIKYFDIPEDEIIAYVQEKPYATIKYDDKDGKHIFKGIKDGFHICYIYPFTAKQRLFIYDQTKEYFKSKKLFDHIGFSNSYDSVFDISTIIRNNWLMYGSYKYMGNMIQTYTCKYYYDFWGKKHDVESSFGELVGIFDVRQYPDDPLLCKPEYENEIEKYVLSSDRKKQENILSQMPNGQKTTIKQQSFISNKPFNLEDYQDLKDITKSEIQRKTLLIKGLLQLLGQERCDNYDYWSHIGWAIASEGKNNKELYQIFIDYSKQSAKFDEKGCKKLWESSRTDGKRVSIGTLKNYAKLDNEENYKKLMNLYNHNLQETIIKYCYDTDIAQYAYNNYGTNHVYCGKTKTWYDFVANLWDSSDRAMGIYNDISINIKNEFTQIFDNEMKMFKRKLQAAIDNEDAESEEAKIKTQMKERQKLYNKLFAKLSTFPKINSIISACTMIKFSDDTIENKMNQNPYLIGFENGIYDLRSGQFREGKPEDYVSLSTGYSYVEYKGDEPVFTRIENYFKSLFPDDKIKDYVLRYMASRLEGRNSNNQFNIWTGKASNGKSVFTSLLNKVYGDYYHTLDSTSITSKRNNPEQATPALAGIRGKRIVIIQEPDANDEIKIAFIKMISGGQDKITVRELYKSAISFIPQCEFVLICNSIPNLNNVDAGIARRLSVVNFNTVFVKDRIPDPAHNEARADPNIVHHIKNDEWTMPVMWLLLKKYYLEYQRIGLFKPDAVSYATQKYILNSDECREYIDDNYIIDKENKLEHDNKHITIDDFYDTYNAWVKNKNYQRKYRTKAKLIEHVTQIIDLQVKDNIILGLYNKLIDIDTETMTL